MQYIFCDLETTDLNPNNCQILKGSFSKRNQRLRLEDELLLTFRVDRWSQKEKESIQIHGITEEMSLTYENKNVSLWKLVDWVGFEKDTTFVCHANFNNPGGQYYFDYAVLKKQFYSLDWDDENWNFYDFYKLFNRVESTHTLSKESAKKGHISPPGFSLDKLCEYFNIELRHHDCESDRRACENIYVELRRTGLFDHTGSFPEANNRAKGRKRSTHQPKLIP